MGDNLWIKIIKGAWRYSSIIVLYWQRDDSTAQQVSAAGRLK